VSGGSERTLVLIRHAESAPRPGRPASRWGLTARGRQQAMEVAGRIAGHRPGVVVSSPEPKAVETAELIAGVLSLETRVLAGLVEHARETVPFFEDPSAFRAAVLDMLARPRERVFGEESAAESLDRFGAALDGAMDAERRSVAAVAHGTVMSLWLGAVLRTPPAEIWTSLGFCAFAVLGWPSRRLVERDAGA